ncbi:antibiotic biosynthesis monooxygenase [Mycolicibacterium sediminis]|uniref:Antibiotic biosynthesis monooxygenase n=1 Tax=Mycolicibacterium sediminis TaxID=1286180 RepID=A0A7I7QMX9_9MYCO|nr:antibiotic biosynthesis monooxygenase [Mycolicibacterium sediminis]BBY27723.1 antibiotic biosynthesis monooxygenase [Mycolicibacterium sediminis]
MVAIAVTVLHEPVDPEALGPWVDVMRADGARNAGFVDCVASLRGDGDLQQAVAVSFATETQLHSWLDGESRRTVMSDGETRGIRRASSDLVLVDGQATPPGVAAFRHPVAPERDAQFLAAQTELVRISARFPGYEGTVVLPVDDRGERLSVIRFRTARQLSGWMESAQRQGALPTLRSTLERDFSTFTQTTPFGTTVRVEDGQTRLTPGWKSAMLVLLVLYPTVMLLSRFVGPLFEGLGAGPWLTIWLSQVLSVSLLQWVLMPFAVRAMRRWLDPVDGAGLGVTVRGVAIVVAGYVTTLAVFALVTWLQYWDYS